MLATAFFVLACCTTTVMAEDMRSSYRDMQRNPEGLLRSSLAASRATRSRVGAEGALMAQRRQRAEDIKEQRTRGIKQRILDTLGLKDIPKVPANMSASINPSLLSQFYGNQSQSSVTSTTNAPTQSPTNPQALVPIETGIKAIDAEPQDKLIIHAEPLSSAPGHQYTLRFKLLYPEGSEHRVTEANLRLMVSYRKKVRGKKNPGRKVEIKLFQVDEQTHEESLIAIVISMVRHTKWQRLLLPTTLVQEVMESDSRTLNVRLECVDCGKDVELVLWPKGNRQPRSNRRKQLRRRAHLEKRNRKGKHNNVNRTPYLEIHTANRYRRLRRDTSETEELTQVSDGCCQLQGFVDFEAFGWHTWILSPKGFNQTFCVGGCGQEDSGSCCAPVETTALSVVYLNDAGELKRAEIPDLVTHRCGCQ